MKTNQLNTLSAAAAAVAMAGAIETTTYPDGTIATGPGPLPEESPLAAQDTTTRAGDSPYNAIPEPELGMRIEGGDAVTGPMSATFPPFATFADVGDQQAIVDGKPVAIGMDFASKPDTAAQWPFPPRAIVPTVGRKVWFFPNDCAHLHSNPNCIDKAAPMDATITFPWSDFMVNLLVVDHIGQVHAFNSVQLVQPGEDIFAPGTPYATWMPFQVGQARAAA